MNTEHPIPPPSGHELSLLLITLFKGVLYREEDGPLWQSLQQLQAQVRDYVTVLGLELALDEAEGYAFLKSLPPPADDSAAPLPRLIARRPLSFPVSLLLALLRKHLAEHDASGDQVRLILSQSEIVDLIRVFLPDASNEARLIDQIDSHINKVIELGFLRRLKQNSAVDSEKGQIFEVRRILKAYVDGQWLSEMEARLGEYRVNIAGNNSNS